MIIIYIALIVLYFIIQQLILLAKGESRTHVVNENERLRAEIERLKKNP
jgi:hypothetical protein